MESEAAEGATTRFVRGVGLVTILVGLAAAGAVTLGAGWAVQKVNRTIDKRLEDATNKAYERAGEAIRAIPGERYLQLIDSLHGPDDAKRKEARDFLQRLSGVRVGHDLEASVEFGFDGPGPLNAQIFATTGSGRAAIELMMRPENENLVEVRNTIPIGPSPEQLRDALVVALTDLSAILPPKLKDCSTQSRTDGGRNRMSSWQLCREEVEKAKVAFRREKLTPAATQVAHAALAVFNRNDPPTATDETMLRTVWRPLQHGFLNLAILASDLDAHRNDRCMTAHQGGMAGRGCIWMWLHDAGERDRLYGRPLQPGMVVRVDVDTMRTVNMPVTRGDGEKVYWFSHTLDNALPDTGIVALRREYQKFLERMRETDKDAVN